MGEHLMEDTVNRNVKILYINFCFPIISLIERDQNLNVFFLSSFSSLKVRYLYQTVQVSKNVCTYKRSPMFYRYWTDVYSWC